MAVTQYIGERYVPIIDGDWSATKNYEPLTIVISEGDSYTSKRYVPAGTPVTNTDYWALTGNFNGQIQSVIARVSALEGKFPIVNASIDDNAVDGRTIKDASVATAKLADLAVTTAKVADKAITTAKIADEAITGTQLADECVGSNNIQADAITTSLIADEAVTLDKLEPAVVNRSYTKAEADARFEPIKVTTNSYLVCIGDGIMQGISQEYPSGTTGWDVYTAAKLGFSSANLVSASSSAAGWGTTTKVTTLVNNAKSQMQSQGKDPAHVSMVIMGAGINDLLNSSTVAGVKTGAYSAINAALSAFPNAMIHVFPFIIGNTGLNEDLLAMEAGIIDSMDSLPQATVQRVAVHIDCWSWNYDGNDSGVSTNRNSLLMGGLVRVATCIANEINGGSSYNEGINFDVYNASGAVIATGHRAGTLVTFSLNGQSLTTGSNNKLISIDKRYAPATDSVLLSGLSANILAHWTAPDYFRTFSALSATQVWGTFTHAINSTMGANNDMTFLADDPDNLPAGLLAEVEANGYKSYEDYVADVERQGGVMMELQAEE